MNEDCFASGHHGSGLPGISFLRRLSRLAWLAANRRRSLWWLLRFRCRTALAGWSWRPAARRPGRDVARVRSVPDRLASISHQGTKRARSSGAPFSGTPSFDLRVHNPIHWPRAAGAEVAALGPLDLLPSGVGADRIARCRDPLRLRRFHHLEDVQAFHADVAARAGALVRLAAGGAVVHVADADQRLEELLGPDLYRLMTTDVSAFDAGARELHSIGMRRAAMLEHSSWARDPGMLPTVSVLLATRRPALLPQALAAVASQTWPRLELVLALHGNEASFAGVEAHVAALPVPARIVRVPGSAPLGAVLNAAVAAAGGTLLAKMDDDDRYGADHLWDLVLAHEYSRARLVGKGMEFVYLAAADRTVHCHAGRGEAWRASCLAGGTLLISRDDLDRAGGWRNEPRGVDQSLINDVLRAGAGVYRTHGAGFMLVRHGHRHTWETGEDRFLAKADRVIPGWAPGIAGLPDLPRPPDVGGRRPSCAGDERPTATG